MSLRDRISSRSKFKWWQFELRPLAMLGTDFDEGMESTGGDVPPESLIEEARNFAICAPFAPQFADQFAVRLQFGAICGFRKRIEDGLMYWLHGEWLQSTALHCSNKRPISGSEYA